MNVQSKKILMTEKEIKADKEIAILSATLSLISERGFHNTPMSLIAKRSGVSAGIIYHYFENKDALIHALYKDIKRRFSETLVGQNNTQLDVKNFFEQIWLNAYDFYVTHPDETKFLEQYENSPFVEKWDEDYVIASGDEIMIMLVNQTQQMMEDGLIRKMPLLVLHELTFGVAIGIAKQQINGAINLKDEDLREIAIACRRAIEVE